MSNKLTIGPYIKDADTEEAFYYIDKYNLCLLHKPNRGLGDAIGRTLRAWMAYKDDDLIHGVSDLWEWFDGKLIGIRHPELDTIDGKFSSGYWEDRMSRDHYNYTLILLKLWEKRNMYKLDKLKEIVNASPFKVRKMARWTLTMLLWSKSLIGNKTAEWWWLILQIIVVNVIYVPLHKIGTKIAGWDEEVDQDEWINNPPTPLQEQRKLNQIIDKIIYPSYAILFAALQIYASNHNLPKLLRTLQKSYLKMVGKTNYVQRMLLGEKVPREKIEEYKSMKGGRWSGYLNGRSDRTMYVFDPPYEYNQLDRDFARAVWNETQL